MCSKKSALWILGCAAMLFVLAGCAQAWHDSGSANQDANALHFADGKKMGDGNGSGNGYYRIVPRSDASNNIFFVDYETASQVPLCSRPECQHQDDTCTSWLPYTAGKGAIFAAGDFLYDVCFGNQNSEMVEEIGEDALPKIIQMKRNGSEKKTVYTFPASSVIREGIVYDNSAIYFICDSFENFEQNGNLPERVLYQYRISDGTMQILKVLSAGDEIIGASGREILLGTTENVWDLSVDAENLQTSVRCCNVHTGEEYALTTHPYLTIGRVYGDVYYLYDPLTTCLSKIEIEPNAKAEVIRQEVFGEEFRSYPYEAKTIFDNHLFIMYEIPENKEQGIYTTNLQAIDLSSGKPCSIEMRVEKVGGMAPAKQVEIVDETEKQFLVISSVEYRMVEIPAGGSSMKLEYPYFHYALMDKQDYYHSNMDAAKIIA